MIYGSAEKPVLLHITSRGVEFLDAKDLWGLNAYDTDKELQRMFSDKYGFLMIGRAGENLVKFSVVVSERGNAGGRPGIGAVMGSKKLKAIAIKGSGEIPVWNEDQLSELFEDSSNQILTNSSYDHWLRQGTMAVIEWAQANSVLPTYNFKEGIFENAENIGGEIMENFYKVSQKGCPYCIMPCGNITVGKKNGEVIEAQLDYENVAMLGANLGIGRMDDVIYLNRLCDEYGLDTISTGNVLGFVIESKERGFLDKEKIEFNELDWGNAEVIGETIKAIAEREGFGNQLAEGVRNLSLKMGQETRAFAMEVKGLEISAYDCHTTIAMALAYGTSPIGAHHKDAWIISWEIQMGRDKVIKEKVEKLVWLQNVRGGIFESLVVCRFPWIELGLDLDWYIKFFKAVTGISLNISDFFVVADRIYNLIRAFWIREYGTLWSRSMDYPPMRWFKEPLTKGPFKGYKLNFDAYQQMLNWYYDSRGWDDRGIPKKSTLRNLGLLEVVNELESIGVKLAE